MNTGIPSPCYVLYEDKLRQNLALIQSVSHAAGVEIILAFKGFAMWSAFPIVREYIQGATASSLHEARLCMEEMKSLAHTYAVAFRKEEFDQILSLSSHITFNSLGQYDQFKKQVLSNQGEKKFGLRINPEYSDVSTDLYNPSSATSRLGVTAEMAGDGLPEGIDGLHFHVLCESDSYALERVLENLEKKFPRHLQQAQWLNMGGGHLMTREGYDIGHLITLLKAFKEKWQLDIILEPGSAFAWQCGDLHCTVLDIVENAGVKTAIIDGSFTAHMPDCLEMPYKPRIKGANLDPAKAKFPYRIGGTTCLAGDFMEEYGFDKALKPGDPIVFEDMVHYTMVKTTTFNGVPHPAIGMMDTEGQFRLIREFQYEDYKNRLS